MIERITERMGRPPIVATNLLAEALGTALLRASMLTACRSARAVALKIASAMWWLLEP